MHRIQSLITRLFAPVDILPLVFFRIAFGGIMLWEVWRYFNFGRITRYYIEPTYWFPYWGFEWIRPLPGDGMIYLFHFIGLLSVLIMVGAAYRLTMTVFWLCFSYIFLLDQAQYLNHFYLISLISFLLIFVPAHRAWSVDALLRPSIRSQVAPNWSVWLLRGQMAIVYFFGGIAKINADWLAGEPLREWMGNVTDFPVIGHLFTEEWMIYLFSYGGLLLDLFVVPFLLWRRTRLIALAFAIGFHVTNARLFNIGIFPWFAIAATLIFLPPHWFRLRFFPRIDPTQLAAQVKAASPRLILGGMALFFAVQILLPLRHFLYPGNPSWTEEGHNLAWHMRLRSKDADITFLASDPATGSTWEVPAWDYLSPRQYNQMLDNPDMIVNFSQYVADQLTSDGYEDVQIRVNVMASLNNRAPQLMLDPTADLTRAQIDPRRADWILPLVQRPVPHVPIPALLVSRRADDTLILVNITRSVFPLAALTISDGTHTINGADFGVSALMPDECVLAYGAEASLQTIFLPCNENGSRLQLDTVLTQERLTIETGDGHTYTCDNHTCVVMFDVR